MKALAPAVTSLALLAPFAGAAETYTPGLPVTGTYENFAADFLDRNCIDCHDDATTKGDLSLENLGPVDETNAAVWKAVWAQVSLQEMPPKDKDQPEMVARLRFSDWIVGELQREMKDKGGFKDHLDPKKGNFLDHGLLFGDLPEGIRLVPTSSPARIWRVTTQEHMTRMNELINTEPKYDPAKPGLRTHGDDVPTNHGGELKLYFGVDNVISHQGGTVAYATAVKSIPAVFSSSHHIGFENYADFNSVNSAEATQVLAKAEDIVRYMAYGPLSIAKPEQITDNPNTYKMEGDLRGLPSSLVYSTTVLRPLTPVHELMKQPEITAPRLRAAVEYLFEALTYRPPTSAETDNYVEIVNDSIAKVGREDGVFMGLSSLFLDRDALFRPELAEGGKPDEHGRVMLQDWELGLAVNHALCFIRPDEKLRDEIAGGRMRTREDVEREVTRMLDDDSIRKPRILRFFREYFDYDLAGYICKDDKALSTSGAPGKEHYRAMFDAKASDDLLIEMILEKDKDVFRELLTTRQVVATQADKTYYGRLRSDDQKAGKQPDEAAIAALDAKLAELEAAHKSNPKDKKARKEFERQRKQLAEARKEISGARKRQAAPGKPQVVSAALTGPATYARVGRNSFGAGSLKPERILATAPEGERLGILTHPAWLVSQSDAMDNHAIHRGKWIRERLLGGGIPDVPITVDAMLPDDPDKTLRERMQVTREKYCWTCHEKMDPLGLPFELFNHAGLYRLTDLTGPVNTTGEIIDSGDPALDGPVKNAVEMIQKLSESERVEQVFVRHAFRFWMGRNETLNDRPVLIAAHKAYRDSGGSMKALLVSLLTSDAFLYRKVPQDAAGAGSLR